MNNQMKRNEYHVVHTTTYILFIIIIMQPIIMNNRMERNEYHVVHTITYILFIIIINRDRTSL